MPKNFIRMDVDSDHRLGRKLKKLIKREPEQADEVMGGFAENSRRALKSEPAPPKRPNQRYVRTGKFASSWGVDRRGVARYTIRNSQGYSGWVAGKQQAWIHKNRWWIAVEVLQRSFGVLRRNLRKAYMKLWRK